MKFRSKISKLPTHSLAIRVPDSCRNSEFVESVHGHVFARIDDTSWSGPVIATERGGYLAIPAKALGKRREGETLEVELRPTTVVNPGPKLPHPSRHSLARLWKADLPGLRAYLKAAAAHSTANPTSADAFIALGDAHNVLFWKFPVHGKGALKPSAKAYAKALEVDPTHAVALNNYGVVMCDEGEAKAALALFRKAARRLDDGAITFNMGVALMALGQGERGRQHMLRAGPERDTRLLSAYFDPHGT